MSQAWVALGGKRRTLARQVYHRDTHCWICGQWVDQTLPRGHPKSRSVDHPHERQDGGAPLDLDNLHLAHLGCNSSKGASRRWARYREARQANETTIMVDPSML